MTSSHPQLSRRSLLAGGAAVTLAAACGRSTAPAAATFSLQPGFADGLRVPPFLVAGRQQMVPIVITDDAGRPLRLGETPETIEFVVLGDGEEIERQVLIPRGEGIFVPHYSPVIAVDEPGVYQGTARMGTTELAFDFRVAASGEVAFVGPGDALVSTATPTVADPLDVEPLCTLLPDPCPFHEMSLDEAIDSGKPVVFLIATPAFCQTAICGPVVDMLVDRLDGRSDVAVVHAEVWKDEESVFTPDGTTAVVQAFGLEHEPALWVAEPGGLVRSRLDFAWDLGEFDEALAAAEI